MINVDKYTKIELKKCPHILVGGSTGSGKSYLLKSMLCDILEDSDYRVLVIDPKSVDYQFLKYGMRPYEGRSGIKRIYSNGLVSFLNKSNEWIGGVRPDGRYVVSRDVDEDDRVKMSWSERGIALLTRDDIDSLLVSDMLKSLVSEMDIRYSFMMSRGYVDWQEYLDAPRDDKWQLKEDYTSIWGDRRITVLIDELADLIYWDRSKTCEVLEESIDVVDGKEEIVRSYESLDSEYWKMLKGSIEKYLVRLSCLGRAAGIHLILGTQRPDATVLSGQLRANIPTRIALRVSNPVERRIILGDRCKDLGERVLFYNNEYKELVRALR